MMSHFSYVMLLSLLSVMLLSLLRRGLFACKEEGSDGGGREDYKKTQD